MWRLAVVLLICTTSVTAADKPILDPGLRAALEAAIAEPMSFDDRYGAEVWLLDMSTRLDRLSQGTTRLSRHLQDHHERFEILRGVHREATRVDLDPNLVLALIEVESTFDRYAISRSGAQGLMQIMPFWLKELGMHEANLMDINVNLRLGCTILKHYLDREGGDTTRALARYNGSVGKPEYPNKVLSAHARHWYRQ
ncbi:MAG: lytic transglycosylase domain-containing protein [Gammaproteobacteria bacterium]|nr:lytic transglycosylase domain-containing protein [Gammaproteobacteria bacterium]MCP5137344.1 lytic transglycosylase domain-containing protein [Gammaproteobacteria bacterium]